MMHGLPSTLALVPILTVALTAACGNSSSGTSNSGENSGQAPTAQQDPVAPSETAVDTPQAGNESPAAGPKIQWHTDETRAFAEAKSSGRGVLVDVRSTWCLPCEELDRETFSDAEVIRFVNRHYVALQLDVSAQTDADAAIQERYKAPLLPAVIFMAANRDVRARFDKFIAPNEFLSLARSTVKGP